MKKKTLFIIFVLIVCGGLGFYFYKKLSPKTQKGVKIEPVVITNNKRAVNVPLPDLNKEIKITADMSEDAKRIATDKIKEVAVNVNGRRVIYYGLFVIFFRFLIVFEIVGVKFAEIVERY